MRILNNISRDTVLAAPVRGRVKAVYHWKPSQAQRQSSGAANAGVLRRFFYVSILSLLSSGCVSVHDWAGGHTNAFPGPDRSDSEVATIRTPVIALDGVNYGGYVEGYPMNVKVLPGAHRIRIMCAEYRKSSYPLLRVTLEAGKSYEQYCKFDGDTVEAGIEVRH